MIPIHAARTAFLAFTLGWFFVAGAEVAVPPLAGRVTDQTATLTAAQKATLEQTLQALEARKGSQVALLIVPTTTLRLNCWLVRGLVNRENDQPC